MALLRLGLFCVLVLLTSVNTSLGLNRFVSLTGAHVAPFTNWSDAATNIQAAIDAASAGDVVLVTNGIYSSGGKVMSGDLTNRVALNKALTVQSVNGFQKTIIEGFGATTNNTLSVRCAWVTNGAVLNGFTLRSGSTRRVSDFLTGSGGGAWCYSSNAVVSNCLIQSNSSHYFGAGVYQGTLFNCLLSQNVASANGGSAYKSSLNNCTVVTNSGYGTVQCLLTNCISYFNSPGNDTGSTLAYSCSTPLAAGTGNISSDPQIFLGGYYLSSNSPCRFAGTVASSLTDVFGNAWANSASMGWAEARAPFILVHPVAVFDGYPLKLSFSSASLAGQEPFGFSWQKDGTTLPETAQYIGATSSNLVLAGLSPKDTGDYQLVASNAFGVVTSAVDRVFFRAVNGANETSSTPFTTWDTAAKTIQEAIDISQDGDVILVTNGVYSSGGKVMFGDLTNVIALDRKVRVASVNGAPFTTVSGAWDAATNGPAAIRCAWLTNGAVLQGFTLQGGATRSSGGTDLQCGGAVWGWSTQAQVINCYIYTNASSLQGGGNYQAALDRCKVIGNYSINGGGRAFGSLTSTLLTRNRGAGDGAGVYGGEVRNCTIVDNTTEDFFSMGGMYAISYPPRNSVIAYNKNRLLSSADYTGPGAGNPTYCCIPTLNVATCITGNPQFTDDLHIAVTSPCRNAGSSVYASGTDFDGEPWSNTPSIGCDEVYEAAINGPLSVSARLIWSEVVERQFTWVEGAVDGRATRVEWNFGDGSVLTNVSSLSPTHTWTNAGDFTATFTAFNSDFTNGVSTTFPVHVVPLIAPKFLSMGLVGTNFTVNFLGQSNVLGFLERATNLTAPVNWQSVGSFYSFSNSIQVTDGRATNSARFYRVRIP